MKKRALFALGGFIASTTAALAGGMIDDPLLSFVKVDQFELRDAEGGNSFVWDAQGWVGYDLKKLWIKTEGERVGGETEEAEVQFLYSRSFARYWDVQAGWRRDIRPEPNRDWAVLGVQGLAPYFFEVDAALFVGTDGRTAARLEAEYEFLITQRLILTPDIEFNLYGKDDPLTGVGSGLSDMELGLRLRYEIRREFAPYVGVNWIRKFGGTADFARVVGASTNDVQWVAGLRAWF
ncbi:MAG TPA: copper resistance protein B [Acidiferrobacteraceae bacterium]|nr:copper resistance protein B [Acidiferrobacteraceae bacterium]